MAPLYRVVSPKLSRDFYNILKERYPGLQVKYNEVPSAGHDFNYWNSELVSLFSFFEEMSR
jgi:enterochelin esterase-like enzyme